MAELQLWGCRTEPLMSYLKSLGLFRIVFQQADSECRAFWKRNFFCLDTKLTMPDLLAFFHMNYSPTPVVTPWNGGAGFDGFRTRETDFILQRTDDRFSSYRETIKEILGWKEIPPPGMKLGELRRIIKDTALLARSREGQRKKLQPVLGVEERLKALGKSLPNDVWNMSVKDIETERSNCPAIPLKAIKKLRTAANRVIRDENKNNLVSLCRSRLNDRAVEWLDAVVAVGGDGKLAQLPLLGTGGNEGRLDYGRAFMNALMEVSHGEEKDLHLLRSCLLAEPTESLVIASVGKHDPGRAGGFNQGAEIETKNFPNNPWDFILAMEGTIAWAGGISRRHASNLSGEPRTRGRATSPFTVTSKPVGYASQSEKDQALAEIWTPVWNNPTGYQELRYFLSEGRADIGRRPATTTVEFAEAVTSLGVDRGVTEFVRHTILKRRGESYLSLPVGRFPVQARRESDLIRQMQLPLSLLDGFLRSFSSNAPHRFTSARMQIDTAIYEVLLRGGASRVKDLVAAIGRMEKLLAQRDLTKPPALGRPLAGLSPQWVAALDDGSLEIRIASALASIQATGDVGPIRCNLEKVDPKHPWKWAKSGKQSAWNGVNLCDRLSHVLQRRMMDSDRVKSTLNPTFGLIRLHPSDIAVFLDGMTDDGLIEDLLYGMLWIDWSQGREALDGLKWKEPLQWRPVPRQWSVLKLLFLPGGLLEADKNVGPVMVKPEPGLIPMLKAGRTRDACSLAQRRLYARGLRPYACLYPNFGDGERLAASLLVPAYIHEFTKKAVLAPTSD